MGDFIYILSGYPCLISMSVFTSSEIARLADALNKKNIFGNHSCIICMRSNVAIRPVVLLMHVFINREAT